MNLILEEAAIRCLFIYTLANFPDYYGFGRLDMLVNNTGWA